MEVPMDFKNTPLPVNCLIATLSASDVELGLPPAGYFTYFSDNQGFSIILKAVHTSKDLIIDILKQTRLPSLETLIGPGTSGFKVKERNSGTKNKQPLLDQAP